MKMVTVLEHCQVSPPPGTVSNKSLPLTFFDLPCLHFFPMQPLLFFESPISKDHFAQLVIPSLKHSISLALKRFFPLAGNLVFPPNSGKPEIRYRDGDSITLIFAEPGDDDFYHFEQNHRPKYTSAFHALAPQVQPGSMSDGMLAYPLMAIQVTHFPNQGICIGFTIHHVACDGRAVSCFIKTWGLIAGSGGKETIPHQMLPSYDRTLVRDPTGIELETFFWNLMKDKKFGDPLPTIPRDMVRATFVMSPASVEQLRKHVTALCGGGPSSLAHISALTITCGYAWSCMAKARSASGEEVDKDEDEEYFVIPANVTARIAPPLPTNYFGNCLAQCFAGAKSRELVGDDGFVIASKSIADAIHQTLHELEEEAGVVKVAMNWISQYAALEGKRVSGAISSPKLGSRNMDFGWGRCKGVEILTIDYSDFLSLNDCMDGEGYTSIGLSLPKNQMEAFASIFADGLKEGARLRCLL